MQNVINQMSCPFCECINDCMARSESPCWCNNVVVPDELAAIVPLALQRKSCICLSCINLFNKKPPTV